MGGQGSSEGCCGAPLGTRQLLHHPTLILSVSVKSQRHRNSTEDISPSTPPPLQICSLWRPSASAALQCVPSEIQRVAERRTKICYVCHPSIFKKLVGLTASILLIQCSSCFVLFCCFFCFVFLMQQVFCWHQGGTKQTMFSDKVYDKIHGGISIFRRSEAFFQKLLSKTI